jgi:hypothetical protein
VAESAASGRVAEIYVDIRRVLGLPMVNLFYRHLATRPELLEEAWTALRPNLGSEAAEAGASALTSEAASSATAPTARRAPASPAAGSDAAQLGAATLDAYARANSLNLLGMHALLDGCPGTGEGGGAVEPPAVARILPMADLASLPAPVRTRLDELGVALLGAEEPRIVPSLLRHFAQDLRLLERLGTALRPAVAEIPMRAERVMDSARALAAGLPYPVAAVTDEAARTLARRFSGAMSRMLVAGEILRTAVAEEL